MRKKRQLLQLQIDAPPVVMAERDLQPTWGGARRGAGRKKGDSDTVTVSIRMSRPLKSLIEMRSQSAGMSTSEYLLRLIRDVELGSDDDY